MFAVYRLSGGPSWHKIRRDFATEAQAQRYVDGLPKDWVLEVREVTE